MHTQRPTNYWLVLECIPRIETIRAPISTILTSWRFKYNYYYQNYAEIRVRPIQLLVMTKHANGSQNTYQISIRSEI